MRDVSPRAAPPPRQRSGDEVQRLLVALERVLQRGVYAPYREGSAWQNGVFSGPEGTSLLDRLWTRAVHTFAGLIRPEAGRNPKLRRYLERLGWDPPQLASVTLPFILAKGGHRLTRMRRKMDLAGPVYARNWVLRIAVQRARKELAALARRTRHEYEAGRSGTVPTHSRDAYGAGMVAAEILPLLGPDHRRVLLVYSVHQFAAPGTRRGRASIRDAARHLTTVTCESWTYHRVRTLHDEIRSHIAAHADPTNGRLLSEVVAILTVRIANSDRDSAT